MSILKTSQSAETAVHWHTTKIKTIQTLKESRWIHLLQWRQFQTQANAPLFLHHLETSACPLLETRFASTMVVKEALPKILRWSSTAAVVGALRMWLVLLIRSLGPDSGNQMRTRHFVLKRAVALKVSLRLLYNSLNLDNLIERLLPQVWSPHQTIPPFILITLRRPNTWVCKMGKYWGLSSLPLLFGSVMALKPALATLWESPMGTGRPWWTRFAATLMRNHLITCTSSRRS